MTTLLPILLLIVFGAALPSALAQGTVERFELAEDGALAEEIVSIANDTYSVRLTTSGLVEVREESVVGVRDSLPPGHEEASPSGRSPRGESLRFAGSNTIGEKLVPELVKRYWEAGLERYIPGTAAGLSVPVNLQFREIGGSSTAFEALRDGTADIGMSSRPIKDTEFLALARLGDFKDIRSEHVIGLDGLAVITHPENLVTALTIKQIARIFACEITDWSMLDTRMQGPIILFAQDDRSGTWDTFRSLVLEPSGKKLCSAVRRFESSTKLSESVNANHGGIGFIGLPYILGAKALKVLECDLAYGPTSFSVKTEEYPLSRRLFFYTPLPPSSPFTEDFVDFVLSSYGQRIVDDVGFVSLAIAPDMDRTQNDRMVAAGLNKQNGSVLREFSELTQGAARLSVTFRFRSSEAALDNRARRDLDRIAEYLLASENQDRELILLGFADNLGDYSFNLRLSRRRAAAVAEELRTRGVPVAVVKGLGEEAPVACNTSNAGAARNRRVEAWLR